MLRFLRLSTLVCFVFLFVGRPSTFAQPGGFCPGDLQPNGYIDFSQLHPAPVTPNGQMSSPVSATLAVQGISGLKVTIQIPSLAGQGAPVYTTNGGTLTFSFPSIPPNSSPNLLTLVFSQPVQGVGVLANLSGRFPFNLSLAAGDGSSAGGLGSVLTYNPQSDFADAPYAVPLQTRGIELPFSNATVTFSGGQYAGIAFSDLRIQSVKAPDLSKQVPTDGLMQWLRADVDAASDLWQDQSGNGHDATQTVAADEPALYPSGNHCQPAFSFSGNSFFNFDLPIAGWHEMTVFLVGRSNKNPLGVGPGVHSAIFWAESQAGGSTYVSPFQTDVDFSFGTTQPSNESTYHRPDTVGQDFTLTRAVHSDSRDLLYVNGIEVFTQVGRLPSLSGATGAGTIGKGSHNTYFDGQISEILVYNRVLTANEAALVEGYFRNKYGLR